MQRLTEKGLILKKGTIVDSTIIEAPSSTKNKKKERDPDAHQMKKGNTWHFGYKAHIEVDQDSGLVHSIEVTGANTHDVTMVPKLLTGEENTVYGDSGYLAPKNGMTPLPEIPKAKRSNIRPTADRPRARKSLPVPKHRFSAANTKSHLSGQRWSMYSE